MPRFIESLFLALALAAIPAGRAAAVVIDTTHPAIYAYDVTSTATPPYIAGNFDLWFGSFSPIGPPPTGNLFDPSDILRITLYDHAGGPALGTKIVPGFGIAVGQFGTTVTLTHALDASGIVVIEAVSGSFDLTTLNFQLINTNFDFTDPVILTASDSIPEPGTVGIMTTAVLSLLGLAGLARRQARA